MIRLIILLSLLINILFAIEKDDSKYIYVETKQCFIPILKYLEKGNVDKQFEYNYNYTNPKNMLMNSVKVFYNNKENYNKFIEKWLKYVPNQQLVKKEVISNFIVTYIKDIEYYGIYYILYYENMIVIMNNMDEFNLNYLIDYCNKTKK